MGHLVDPNNGFQVIMENVVAGVVGFIVIFTVYQILLRKLGNRLKAMTIAGMVGAIPMAITFAIAEALPLQWFLFLLGVLLVYAFLYVQLVWRARARIQKSKEEKASKDIK